MKHPEMAFGAIYTERVGGSNPSPPTTFKYMTAFPPCLTPPIECEAHSVFERPCRAYRRCGRSLRRLAPWRGSLCPPYARLRFSHGPLTPLRRLFRLSRAGGFRHGRYDFSSDRRGGFPSLRRPRYCVEAVVTMVLNLLWGVGALVIAGYMVAALLRPERF